MGFPFMPRILSIPGHVNLDKLPVAGIALPQSFTLQGKWNDAQEHTSNHRRRNYFYGRVLFSQWTLAASVEEIALYKNRTGKRFSSKAPRRKNSCGTLA